MSLVIGRQQGVQTGVIHISVPPLYALDWFPARLIYNNSYRDRALFTSLFSMEALVCLDLIAIISIQQKRRYYDDLSS